jgi:hypothetical protein
MALLTDCAEIVELQRLTHLLQIDLQSRISIVRSTEINPSLIATERTKKHRFAIQIDCIRWQKLNANQQDLLFWHEVARIQSKTVPRFGWELPVMAVGLGFALIEVSSQNVISLTAALVAVALAGHQLYQRNRGERSLREVVAADRKAIHFATESGYSFSDASMSLYGALKLLAKSAQQSDWQRYQVRLRALEILATEREKRLVQSVILKQPQRCTDDLETSWQS